MSQVEASLRRRHHCPPGPDDATEEAVGKLSAAG